MCCHLDWSFSHVFLFEGLAKEILHSGGCGHTHCLSGLCKVLFVSMSMWLEAAQLHETEGRHFLGALSPWCWRWTGWKQLSVLFHGFLGCEFIYICIFNFLGFCTPCFEHIHHLCQLFPDPYSFNIVSLKKIQKTKNLFVIQIFLDVCSFTGLWSIFWELES